MIDVSYYDRRGISFLPPRAMNLMSVILQENRRGLGEDWKLGRARCEYALFAGNDLSDLGGWVFGQDGIVYELEDMHVREHPLETFTEWLAGYLAEARAYVGADS